MGQDKVEVAQLEGRQHICAAGISLNMSVGQMVDQFFTAHLAGADGIEGVVNLRRVFWVCCFRSVGLRVRKWMSKLKV